MNGALKLIIIFALSLCARVFGQCVPDASITTPGFYPAELPPAIVDQPYNQVIQVKVLSNYQGFQIKSVDLVKIEGLPSGFTYACNVTNCSWAGGANGCVSLYGSAPDSQMIGLYKLKINLKVVSIITKDTIIPFDLSINAPAGIAGNQKPSINLISYDAGSGNAGIRIKSANAMNARLAVYDILGVLVSEREVRINPGNNHQSLYLSGLAPGLYIVSLRNGDFVVNQKMIIRRD